LAGGETNIGARDGRDIDYSRSVVQIVEHMASQSVPKKWRLLP
jgi:hypothetical protein